MGLDLEAIKARLAAATPGPWIAPGTWLATGEPAPLVGGPWMGFDTPARIADCATTIRTEKECMANAMFIAHAPTDITTLIAEIDRLTPLAEAAAAWAAAVAEPFSVLYDEEKALLAAVQVWQQGERIE